MVQRTDDDSFTFTWRIENFSMIPHKKGQMISSPEFKIRTLDNSVWCLLLSPKGEKSEDYASCYLRRDVIKDKEPKEITVSFNIVAVTRENRTKSVGKHTVKYNFPKSTCYGIKKFIPLKDFIVYKDLLLPNDVLTLIVWIEWGKGTLDKQTGVFNIPVSLANNSYHEERFYNVVSEPKLSGEHRIDKHYFSSEHQTLTTRVEVSKKVIKWTIKDFKFQIEKVQLLVLTHKQTKSPFLLRCYGSDGSVRIEIQRKDKYFKQMLLKCKVSVLDRNGTAIQYLEDEHIFGEGYEIWSFPAFLKLRTIQHPESEMLHDGTLTLQFEFRTSYASYIIKKHRIVSTDSVVSHGLLHDIGHLYEGEVPTDVTLVSEGFELPFHKSVICARSPVFRAMFTHDTQEKRTGVVLISDIGVDTLNDMKIFMYGFGLPDLQEEDAMKLYTAADKYEVLGLKDSCAASLKHNLSLSNVCDVLVLADSHCDVKLLKYVHAFLRENSFEFFRSDEWTCLMENHPTLASKTMEEILATEDSS